MHPQAENPHDLNKVLDAVRDTGPDKGRVSVGALFDKIGERSFGPFLILLAVIAFTPLGGIPGVPTVLASIVVLVAFQLVLGVDHFWLPDFLLRRSIDVHKIRTTTRILRPAAGMVDKVIRPRLTWLMAERSLRVSAIGCILVALTVPPLEIVPFAGSVSWAAIAAFGLAIIARDGVLVLVALGFAIAAAFVLGWTFL